MREIKEAFLLIDNEEDKGGFNLLLKMFEALYSFFIKKLNIRENFEGKNSPKFEELIKTIQNESKDLDNDLTMLIFVNKKMTAKYMHSILQLYYNKKVGFIIGKSGAFGKKKHMSESLLEKDVQQNLTHKQINEIFNKDIPTINEKIFLENSQTKILKKYFDDKYTFTQQLTVIKSFKEKSINFLISTSVTEEGFDVPHCNLVIAYNDINTIRSFIQLKGRARKEDSRFLMFSPEILVKYYLIIKFNCFSRKKNLK